MDDVAIRVEGLGKRYRLGQLEPYKALRDTLSAGLHAPFRIFSAARNRKPEKTASKDVWAIREVSFDVKHGEVVGIIGANGAGKSTLLKVLTRVTEPTEGRAYVRGRVGSLLEVGTGFHPELTGRENIYLSGAILGMKKAEISRKMDEIVAFAGVEKFLDTPVKRYSSGMQVRLGFAVAAHLDTEVLLVDEVLAVGDVAFQAKCLGKMGEVVHQGRTILFVSHNMNAVSNLCSRGVLLDQGQVSMTGPINEVIGGYLSTLQKQETPSSLGQRQDREGDGTVRFVDAWLENQEGERVTTVRSGDVVKFKTSYVTEPGAFFPNDLRCVMSVTNTFGQRIAVLSSWLAGKDLSASPEGGTWTCTVESLPLMPDRYRLDLWCGYYGIPCDIVHQAISFDVVEGDFFSNGRFPKQRRDSGQFLIRQTWSNDLARCPSMLKGNLPIGNQISR